MNVKNNMRAKKTKEHIQTTLFELLSTKNLEDITISELCKTANVNRTTFYCYYKDLNELLAQAEESLSISFDKMLKRESEIISETTNVQQHLLPFLKFIHDHRPFFTAYFKNSYNFGFKEKCKNLMYKGISYNIDKKLITSDEQYQLVLNYYEGGIFTVIKHWLIKENSFTPEDISLNICLCVKSLLLKNN